MQGVRRWMLLHQGSAGLLKKNSSFSGVQKCCAMLFNNNNTLLATVPQQNSALQFSTSLFSMKQNTPTSTSQKDQQPEKSEAASPSLEEIQPKPEVVAQTPLEKSLFEVLEFNKNGSIAEAAAKYTQMKTEFLHEMTTEHYTKIIGSFAPKNLLFKWFKPYRDFVDMYHEAGQFRPEERRSLAEAVFQDMLQSPLQLKPTVASFNALMKVQLSCGFKGIEAMFSTFNRMQEESIIYPYLIPNMNTFIILLRGCAMMELVPLAEEVYSYAMAEAQKRTANGSQPDVGIQLHNALLDVYSEARDPKAFAFFETILQRKLPVNGITFNTYAKACIFRDERIRLVRMTELMRVEGVLQKELSSPIRKEIIESYRTHTEDNYAYSKEYRRLKENDDLIRERLFAPLFEIASWGRLVDLKDLKFLEAIKPYLDKYTIDVQRLSNLRLGDAASHNAAQDKQLVTKYSELNREDILPPDSLDAKRILGW